MCQQCDEIDAEITRHRELLIGVDDPNAIALVNLIIADLESEKTKLHREDK